MPSDSPSTPIRRTSFALISSLSRFSLSFALIVQHLQAKKNTVQRQLSPHGYSFGRNYAKGEVINPSSQPVRRWERSALLCFTRVLYHIFSALSIPFFNFFTLFLIHLSISWYDMICPSENITKKIAKVYGKFYFVCFFTKIFADFRHNWIFTKVVLFGIMFCADGQESVRFPFFAHCILFLRSAKLMASPRTYSHGVQFLFEIQWKKVVHGKKAVNNLFFIICKTEIRTAFPGRRPCGARAAALRLRCRGRLDR